MFEGSCVLGGEVKTRKLPTLIVSSGKVPLIFATRTKVVLVEAGTQANPCTNYGSDYNNGNGNRACFQTQ